MQAYLATLDTVDQLSSDADLDWRDAERIRFVLDVVTEGLSPSNNPLLNPLGWKAMIDTGGLSAVRGLRHFARRHGVGAAGAVDGRARRVHARRRPSPSPRVRWSSAREVFELIQYTPQTDKVVLGARC